MKLEDGTVLRGVAESKDKATARYNEAIAAGKPAGKLEMVAGDSKLAACAGLRHAKLTTTRSLHNFDWIHTGSTEC